MYVLHLSSVSTLPTYTQTLTVFFAVVLAKKYTNPSSDIIEVLAGLDDVDAVFTELVTSLDQATRDGRNGMRVLDRCGELD